MSADANALLPAQVPPWELPDDKLLAQCRFEAFVASGPGGQKRHKTNAAVRYVHLPTGVHAESTDSRSQRENRIHALRGLRLKLAIQLRREIDPVGYRPPAWFAEYPGLRMSPKNPLHPAAVAEVLDVLKAIHWEMGRAAVIVGVSTSALTRFLREDTTVWAAVNRARQQLGMKALTWDR